MNFQWLLLAFFLVAIISNIAKAMRNPMLKNFLRLISILVAFVITFILQVCGVFQHAVSALVKGLEIASKVPDFEGPIANAIDFALPFCTTFLSPLIFTLAFGILYFVLRVIHVNIIYSFIAKRQRKKEIKELKFALKEEKMRMKKAITDNEVRFLSAMEELSIDHPEINTYEYDALDEEEIDRMVEDRIRAEKKKKKKTGFFKESRERKALSIVCGVVCGFLLFGISWMGFFYTMDVLDDVTVGIKDTNAEDTKIYQIVDMLDKHVVDPYHDSFVYELYDSMAIIDLMNYTVRAGGKIEVNGEAVYADDVMRDHMMRSVRLACEITSAKSDQSHIGEDISAITKDPMTVSLMADFLVVLIEKVDTPDPNSDNFIDPLLATILENYKAENGKELIVQDLVALSDIVVIAAENKLLAKVIADTSDLGALLEDQEMIKEMVGAMSGLSAYGPTMETAFTLGVDMIGPVLMPLDNAEGYQRFVDNLVNASGNVTAISDEDLAKLNALMVDASSTGNMLSYLREPLDYIFDVIKPEALEIKDRIEENANEIVSITEQLTTPGLTDEQIQDLTDALNLLKDEEIALADQEKALFDLATDYLDIFQQRATSLSPLITYFMNWNGVQKPFMLADEDLTSACLAIKVGDTTYVCATDTLTIETLVDLIGEDMDFGDLTGGITDGEGSEGGEGGEGSEEDDFDKILNLTVDDYLNRIPEKFRDLLSSLEITSDSSSMQGRVSELTDLVNYLIVSAIKQKNQPDAAAIDNAWLYAVLSSYNTVENVPANCVDLADRIVLAKDTPEIFEYKGVTVAKMNAGMDFGEDWDADAKENDSEKLVEIIYSLMGLMDSMKQEEAETMNALADGTEGVDNAEIEKLLGLLKSLGAVMDKMAETHCLKGVPPVMIEGVLKHEMLSMAMTPAMLYGDDGYMSRIESGELSYEEFMEELADMVTGILEKMNNKEGETV